MAPTPVTVADLQARVRLFLARGGAVARPPHNWVQRQRWRALALRYREEWENLPSARRTDRLRSGLAFQVAALRSPRCFVALFRGELAAALSYEVHVDHLAVKVVGSRQLEEAVGAGTALEQAMAEEGVRPRPL